MEISKTKVEQRAITKIRDLIDKIEIFSHSFKEMDKNISWDGTIEMYNGNIDVKENYDYTIDVQVKGRTTNNKKFSSKYRFPLDKTDLENYLKKDGTILITCLFKKDGSDFRIYCTELLPYNIRLLLKQCSSNTIKVDLKEIKTAEQFENICRNFKLDKEIQKGIKSNIFDQNNLSSSKGKVTKFYTWNKEGKYFNPQNLVGTWKYIYTLDENGYAINVSYGMLCNIVETLNAKVYSKEKELIFDDVKLETKVEGKNIIFGKAFTMDCVKNKFNIKICGKLIDRIKQLEFITKISNDKIFYINDIEFSINIAKREQSKFTNLLEKYKKLRDFFNKHGIDKEIDFDTWKDCDFNYLEKWIDAIENHTPMEMNSDISMLGSISIRDIRLSVFAVKRDDGNFDILSVWNNNRETKYYFKYGSGIDEIETTNFYLILNAQAYQADDINIEEMKVYMDNVSFSDGEYELMNLQLLEVLKAYDITKKVDLINYAKYLIKKLLEHEPNSPIYYINYAQTLKREGYITDEIMKKIIEIRDSNVSIEIKISCNLLLDNKTEANILAQNLNKQTLEEFKKYPIAIYL